MTEIKNDVNESWSSNLIFLRENHFQRNPVSFTIKIDSKLSKCLIFVGSFQNFSGIWEGNNHSGLGKILTLPISKMKQTPIFILGWVIGTTSKPQFCPIPSPLILIFQKNSKKVQLTIQNWKKIPDIPVKKLTKIRGTELDKTEHREWIIWPIPM